MSGGSTYQKKPENRPKGLSKYVYQNFCYRQALMIIVHGIKDQLITWHQFGKKTSCYILKISKLYVEKRC